VVCLLLDGLLDLEAGGRVLARLGPGAIVGERSRLDGHRTARLRAVTACRVAVSRPENFGAELLAELACQHRAQELDRAAV